MRIEIDDAKFKKLLKQVDDVADGTRIFELHQDVGAFVRDDARLRAPENHGELSQSIDTNTEWVDATTIETEVFTNKEYAHYVEFGTGLNGQNDNAGISPNIQPRYTQSKWWVSDIDFPDMRRYFPDDAISYDQNTGISFVLTSGQRAQPYLYPALAENIDQVIKHMKKEWGGSIKRGD